MECASCGGPASQTCANCGSTAYCSKDHQRSHWPKHKADCFPSVVRKSEKLGRFLAASRDLKAGSLLIREWPLVVGPCPWSQPVCLGCHNELQLQSSRTGCSRCAAPVCQMSCQDLAIHRLGECRALSPRRGAGAELVFHMAAVLPLRCLLGVRGSGVASQWQGFLQLESHLEKRRGTAVWDEQKEHVVKVLKNFGLIAKDGSEDELIQKICAVLDVNSFEVRGPGAGQLRAMYLRTALMAHDCVPNVHLAVDDELQITVRANRDIAKGEALYYNYCAVLQNTAARQERLRMGKYFECQCERCSDPTELGSHLSSLWCVRCRVGLVVPQQLQSPEVSAQRASAPSWLEQRLAVIKAVPEALSAFRDRDPATRTQHQLHAWRCGSCGWRLSERAAGSTLARAQELWEAADRQDIRALESLLQRLGGSLAPTHALLLDVKQVLLALYRDQAHPSHQARVTELCEELLSVLDVLEPGRISRLKGITLHEIHIALLLGGGGSCAAQRLERAHKALSSAISHLQHEPPNTPEGGLHALALQELATLSNQFSSPYTRGGRQNRKTSRKSKRS